MISVGVIEGSSVMGLSEDEYAALSEEKKKEERDRVRGIYKECGADHIIENMSELCALIDAIESK